MNPYKLIELDKTSFKGVLLVPNIAFRFYFKCKENINEIFEILNGLIWKSIVKSRYKFRT